jgi:glycosyltransferase involved in cell wall biosynthesis
MDHKVSIIVPVYGVEKYIGACIESLIAQTYRNLEILLVDDGGKDKSGEICDRYAAQDDRIRVIHKPNGGAASARNAGLDVATGELICFVDGDDAVRPDYVKQLLTYVTDRNADIAVCGFCNWCRSGTKQVECHNTDEYTGQEYLLRFLRDWSCSLLWNKIYRREVIGDIRMEEGHKVDDEFFTYQVVMNCSKVVLFETPLYDYRLRNSSAMQDMSPYLERIMLDRVAYITARYQNIANRMPQIEPDYFLDTLDTITRYWYHSKNMPEAQKRIRKWVKEHTKRIITMNLPWHIRLAYLKQLYIRKPTVMSEPNPLQMDAGEYFD